MAYNKKLAPLEVILKGKKVYLFFKDRKKSQIHIATALLGSDFKIIAENISIGSLIGKEKNLGKCNDFKITKLKNGKYFLIYTIALKNKKIIKTSLSNNLINWEKPKELNLINIDIGEVVPKYTIGNDYVMYFGKKQIKIAFSNNLKKWKVKDEPILKSRKGYFDATAIKILKPSLIKEGVLLPYFIKKSNSFGVALFDKKNPEKILWRSANPVWQDNENIIPLGVMQDGRELIFYVALKDGKFKSISLSVEKILGQKQDQLVLDRHTENPIIKVSSENSWESQAVLNPGAIYLDGRIHLVYRAIGADGNSTIGYASSKDGINFDERLNKPIYIPTKPFESRDKNSPDVSIMLMSGGGYGGCEDPRLTMIDGIIYMMYVAFNGWEAPRVALTSIKAADFLNKKWNWKSPVLISPPGEIHKNWVLFPEKFNNKYSILHSLCPEISIANLDNLDFDGRTFIKSYYNSNGNKRRNCWDGWVRGAGPPPIKTKDGWLLMYHAMDHKDPDKYKLGAMMLDINDPTKVLYRAENPILEPQKDYENQGFKAGVVYACGAVVMNGKLFIYYGAADTVVCVATANLDEFLKQLKNSKEIKLELLIKKRNIKNEIKKI